MSSTCPFPHRSAVSAVGSEDDIFKTFDFSKEKYGLVIKKKKGGPRNSVWMVT